MLVGSIWFLLAALSESIIDCLFCILVPFYSLYFLISHFAEMHRPFAYQTLGFYMILSNFGGAALGEIRRRSVNPPRVAAVSIMNRSRTVELLGSRHDGSRSADGDEGERGHGFGRLRVEHVRENSGHGEDVDDWQQWVKGTSVRHGFDFVPASDDEDGGDAKRFKGDRAEHAVVGEDIEERLARGDEGSEQDEEDRPGGEDRGGEGGSFKAWMQACEEGGGKPILGHRVKQARADEEVAVEGAEDRDHDGGRGEDQADRTEKLVGEGGGDGTVADGFHFL